MKSIIQDKKRCFVCKTTLQLEDHHIFGGCRRKLSEKHGLRVWLCNTHHNQPKTGAHFNKELMNELHIIGQTKFEELYGHDKFMEVFKKNYRE